MFPPARGSPLRGQKARQIPDISNVLVFPMLAMDELAGIGPVPISDVSIIERGLR
jgi:hypothetical protein